MNQKLSIPCPECNTELSIPSAGYLGKTVVCPQCQNTFLLKEPATEELPVSDAIASAAAAANPPPAPAAFPFAMNTVGEDRVPRAFQQASPARPRGNRNWLLIGTGSTVMVLIILLLVALLPEPVSTTELDYMPDNTEIFVRVRLKEVLESDLGSSILESVPSLQQMLDQIIKQGISPRDIQSIAYGISSFSTVLDNREAASPMNMDFTVLLRLTRPVNTDNLAKIFEAQNRGMRKPIKTTLKQNIFYVSHPYENNHPPVALYVINNRTLLFGAEQSVRRAVRQDGKSRASGGFHFLDSSYPVLVGFVPRNMNTFDKAITQFNSDQAGAFNKAVASARGTLTGLAMGIQVGNGFDVSSTATFTGRGAAKTFITEIESGFATMKQEISRLGNVATGPQALATRILSTILRDVQTLSKGKTAEVRFSIPRTTVDLALTGVGVLGIPGFGNLLGKDDAVATNENLEDEMTKLILEGVTEESLSGIKSMFDDPEYVLMDYLDRWLTDNIGAAVTINASIDKEEAIVEIAGIDDVEMLGKKIDFAEVLEVNKRRNMVTARWHAPDQK
ncbi:MAG: hypothetical protein CMJ73_04060 [Planctomycetaceae bacterium]|nr:hypothetical protein [Planctomycetaceae bacterium]